MQLLTVLISMITHCVVHPDGEMASMDYYLEKEDGGETEEFSAYRLVRSCFSVG